MDLQGLPQYVYAKTVTRTKVLAALQTYAVELAAAERQKALNAAAAAAEEERKQAIYRPAAVRGQQIWRTASTHPILMEAQTICSTILRSVEFPKIIIGGSWPASVVAKVVCACNMEITQIDIQPDRH